MYILFKDYHDYEMRVLSNDLIILNHNNESINDQIINLLNPVCLFNKKCNLIFGFVKCLF
jgi:hypothetical protein